MTMLRTDLMDLGIDALMALANPGFVKRAQKDIAAGTLPELTQDADGTVHAAFDAQSDAPVRTSIGPGDSLRDAVCSCIASGMCRHRVALVLAYQASQAGATSNAAAADNPPERWNPARFDDAAIAASVTPQVLEQARRLALERPVATVLSGPAGGAPAVVLPMSQVRFFSSTSLAHARCDCQQGLGCAHVVLALWACRQAEQSHPGQAEATLEVAPFGVPAQAAPGGLMETEAALLVRQQVQDWLWSLWREGASQPLLGLEARHAGLADELGRLGWTWVREALDTVWHILQALAQRSNRFDMGDLVRASAGLHARLQAAVHADATPAPRLPASQILGIGQQGETALDLLRLVSLGMTCWRDDAGVGAGIVFADPDTQAACVLERDWPLEAGAQDGADLAASLPNRRVAGYPLKSLAAGQLVTRAAKRRANASLELGGTARQTSVLALSPKAWDDLRAPLRFGTLEALLGHLRSRPPAAVRSGEAGADWHVVDLAGLTLDDWAWDGVRQTLFARWYDAGNASLLASLAYQSLTPGAVDALARALNGEWGAPRAIAGPVWRDSGGLAMHPATILTEERAVVLAIEPKAPHATPLRELALEHSPNDALLRESFTLLGQLLRQGLRHLPPSLRSRLHAQAAQLDEAGYPEAARQLRTALEGADSGAALASLTGLATLLGVLMS